MPYWKRDPARRAWRSFRGAMRNEGTDGIGVAGPPLVLIALGLYAGLALVTVAGWAGVITLVVLSVRQPGNHVVQIVTGIWLLAGAVSLAWELRRWELHRGHATGRAARRPKMLWAAGLPLLPLYLPFQALGILGDSAEPAVLLRASHLGRVERGQLLTVSATVTWRRWARPPTGTVEFRDRPAYPGDGRIVSQALGTSVVGRRGRANLNTSLQALGTHHVTAAYSGDGHHVPVTSEPYAVSVRPAPGEAWPGTRPPRRSR